MSARIARALGATDSTWALFALAEAQQKKIEAECEAARLRLGVKRLSFINPVMCRHIFGGEEITQ